MLSKTVFRNMLISEVSLALYFNKVRPSLVIFFLKGPILWLKQNQIVAYHCNIAVKLEFDVDICSKMLVKCLFGRMFFLNGCSYF